MSNQKCSIFALLMLLFLSSCVSNENMRYKRAVDSVKNSPIYYNKQVYKQLKKYKEEEFRKDKSILLYALFTRSADFKNDLSFIFHCSWITDYLRADAIKIIRPNDKGIILTFKKQYVSNYRKALEETILLRTSLNFCSDKKLPNNFSKGTQLVLLKNGKEISNRVEVEMITTKKFIEKRK